MAPRLIAEKGLLQGLELELAGGPAWVIGRDPAEASLILEDPAVSRRQAEIRLGDDGVYTLRNLSTSNPTRLGEHDLSGESPLEAGSLIQMGGTWFRFEPMPTIVEELPEPQEPVEAVSELVSEESLPSRQTVFEAGPPIEGSFLGPTPWRFLLKVLTGPNRGAEFGLELGREEVIGKDPGVCSIVLNDLSVSRRHAKIRVSSDGKLSLEDLGSRNGTLVDGQPIEGSVEINPQNVITIGTTTLTIFDREHAGETIVQEMPIQAVVMAEPALAGVAAEPDWRERKLGLQTWITTGAIAATVLFAVVAGISLFRVAPIEVPKKEHQREITKALAEFPAVQFAYNPSAGSLLLVGHVQSPADLQELNFKLKELVFLGQVTNFVVADSNVWQEMNQLLARNSDWAGVTMFSEAPGQFIVRGAVASAQQLQALQDYINLNFTYRDRLLNQVVVQSILQEEIVARLASAQLGMVQSNWEAGQLTLRGALTASQSEKLAALIPELKRLPGINAVDNLIIVTQKGQAASGAIDITEKYPITGWIAHANHPAIVINGKIFYRNESIDGMAITAIEGSEVRLEKDGVEYKIKYNGPRNTKG
jgi:type III secretion system YscD/HrpQ family protein